MIDTAGDGPFQFLPRHLRWHNARFFRFFSMLILNLFSLSSLAALVLAAPNQGDVAVRQSACTGNTADDRSTWCDYDTSTNYYDEGPDTGVIVEYWFDIQNVTLAPNGVERTYLTVNGSLPGPTIIANWYKLLFPVQPFFFFS